MATLSERLRNFAQGCRGGMWQSRDETIALMDEAADALDAMEAALRECKATCVPDWGALSDQIDAALAMVRK